MELTPSGHTSAREVRAPRGGRSRLQVLVDASRAFAEAGPGLDSVLEAVVRHTSEVTGEVCGIRLIGSDGKSLDSACFHHPDPEKGEILKKCLAQARFTVDDEPFKTLLRTGKPATVFPGAPTPWDRPEFAVYTNAIQPVDILMYPLRTRARNLGVLTLNQRTGGAPFDDEELELLEDLSHWASLAIENALLLQQAEKDRSQLVLLAETSRLMTDSDDVVASLHEVSELVVPALADGFFLELVQPYGQYRREAVKHVDLEQQCALEEIGRRFPRNTSDHSIQNDVIRNRKSVFFPAFSEEGYRLNIAGRPPEYVELLDRITWRSTIVVNLEAHGKTLGLMTLMLSSSGRSFTEKDIDFAEDLGNRIALGLENRRLLDEALREVAVRKQAEERFRTLFEQSPFSLQLFAPDGSSLLANEAWEKLWENKRDQLIGYNIRQDKVAKEVGADVLIERAFAGEDVQLPDTYYDPAVNGREGRPRWISCRLYPLKNLDGSLREVVNLLIDITAQKETELELRRSKNQLDAIFAGVTDGITVIDPRGKFVYANIAGAKACGFDSVDAFLKSRSSEVMNRFEVTDELGEPIPTELLPGRIALNGVKDIPEKVIRVRDRSTGEIRWTIVNATPLFDANGKVEFSISIFRDFTYRRRVEEELRQSEARLRALIEATPQMVWTSDPAGQHDYFNQRWYERMGITREQSVGEAWKDAVHADDLPSVTERWRRSVQTGEPYEHQTRLRAKGGTYRWTLSRARPIHDSSGKIVKWIGTSTDIHDQKTVGENYRFLADASEALNSSLDYEATLSAVARLVVPRFADWCAVDLYSSETGIQRVAVTHADPEKEKFGIEIAKRFPPDLERDNSLAKVLKTGEPLILLDIPREALAKAVKDPERLKIIEQLGFRSYICVPLVSSGRVLGAISFCLAESGRNYADTDLSLAVEIGRRAGLAVDNARLYAEAQSAVQLRDEFLSIASHELRTPLTSLYMQLQVLERLITRTLAAQDSGKLIPKLDGALKQAQRLGTLIDRLLDISRLVNGRLELEKEPVDLVATTSEVVSRFAEEARGAACDLLFEASEPILGSWDQLRVEQALTNLLSNALKYGAGSPVRVGLRVADGFAIVEVEDHGIGIREDDQSRIFERFERAVSARNISGLGMGLYITRQIAEAHGGRVRVRSVPDSGSVFTLELPLR